MSWENKKSQYPVLKDAQAQRCFRIQSLFQKRCFHSPSSSWTTMLWAWSFTPFPKKGDDLTCLNKVHLIGLICGLPLALSGSMSFFLVLLGYLGSTRCCICCSPFVVLILQCACPHFPVSSLCNYNTTLCFFPLWLHLTLYI